MDSKKSFCFDGWEVLLINKHLGSVEAFLTDRPQANRPHLSKPQTGAASGCPAAAPQSTFNACLSSQ